MKFFLYRKNKNKNNVTLDKKHFKIIFLLNLLKLHKTFSHNLVSSLYYNTKHLSLNNNNLTISAKIIPFFIKGGNFFSNSILIHEIFTKFYKMMFNNMSSLKLSEYKYYKEFFYNFNRYSNYKNFNYLLN